MPFYQVFTPYSLRYKSTITASESYSATRTALTFTSGGTSYGRIFQLPLVPKGVFRSSYPDVTVKITVGLDNSVRTTHDSDPKFILTNGYVGNYGMGFELRDENGPHCQGIQGIVGTTLTSRTVFTGKSCASSSPLPDEFTMIIKPNERWGTCYHASDTGIISLASYTRNFLLRNGLYLEVYRESTSERYVFNYIIVEIHEN